MNRIASRGLIGAAALCAGLAAGTVSAVKAATTRNPYVTVSGDVEFDQVTDDSIRIRRMNGPTEIQITPRPGWRMDGPTNVVLQPGGQMTLQMSGKDGEEDKDVDFGDDGHCDHKSSEKDEHTGAPVLVAYPEESHELALYTDPDVGVQVRLGFEWKVATNGEHTVTTTIEPCAYCGSAGGEEEEKVPVTPKPPYAVEYQYPAETIDVNGTKYLPSGSHMVKARASWKSEKCKYCRCSADARKWYNVGYARMNCAEYVGLDMTDAGQQNDILKSAAVVTGGVADSGDFTWTTGTHCVFEDNSAKASGQEVKFKPKDRTIPSSDYQEESMKVSVSVNDKDGCTCEMNLERKYTVVRVDAIIDEVNETDEETKGALIAYYPDKEDGSLTDEAIKGLRPVEFKWYPKQLPEDQELTISAPENTLYVKKGDGYEAAESTYTLKDLGSTKFFLHGHEPSGNYLGEEIEVTHPVSGARDVAKFTILGQPYLIPDYDRDGKIDDTDKNKAKGGEVTFRFWVNDDDDDRHEDGIIGLRWLHLTGTGSINEKPSNVPGQGDNQGGDVDGRCDLLDFVPVELDLSEVFPEDTPEKVKDSVKWKVQSDCLNAVWTKMKPDNVRLYFDHDVADTVEMFGSDLDTAAYKADVTELAEDDDLPKKFYKHLKDNEMKGVFLVEGAKKGEKFKILGSYDKKEVANGKTLVNIDTVEAMYRWLDLRGCISDEVIGTVPEAAKTLGNGLAEPPNNPDADCNGDPRDGRHVFFVHGFNVNANAARGWGSEMFKRLWQSGMTSKFTVVDWPGDFGQKWVLGGNSIDYYRGAYCAFLVSRQLKTECEAIGAGDSIIVIGHSLGNMVLSSAIVDHGLKADQYYMLNAAVAREAYDAGAHDELMIDPDWIGVPAAYRSTGWWSLFDDGDFRRTLTWEGRFKGMKGINYYSPTDDVIKDMNTSQMFGRETICSDWIMQEILKGSAALKVPEWTGFIWSCREGGWGYNSARAGMTIGVSVDSKAAKALTREEVIENPIFCPFAAPASLHSLEPMPLLSKGDPGYEDQYRLRARILTDGIPSKSFSAGANDVTAVGDSENLTDFESDKWPRGKEEWHHSDIKNVAYGYNRKMFNTIAK